MDYRNLGRSGVKVSPLCLGCMTFGREIDAATSYAVMDRAFEAGINFFDTANVYSLGRSEEIVGAWLKERGRRHDIVLATKVFGKMGEGPNDSGLSRRHILEQIDASLRRLQTDWVDIYQVHRFDATVPLEETLSTLDGLVRAGKVRYIGCSNFAAWQLAKALWISDKHGWASFATLQPRYSLIWRQTEDELLPLCADQGLGVIPYSPLAGGFLTGKYRREQLPSADTRFGLTKFYQDVYWSEKSFRVVDAFKAYAEKRGTPLAEMAIAWVASHPAVTAPIIGARTIEHIEQGLRALDLKLSFEEHQQLTALADAA